VRIALENVVSVAGALLLAEATLTEIEDPRKDAAPETAAAGKGGHADPRAQRTRAFGRRKLAEHHRDLIDITIDVERATPHHRQGKRSVEPRCQPRGASLVATAQADELGLALRTFRREVETLRERRRDARAERHAAPPLRGVIDRVVRGEDHGFLITDAGERV
jgi:hypothetical protein